MAFCQREIDNVKYCFDSEGRLLTDWVSVTNFTCTDLDNLSGFGSAADLRYYDEDGSPEWTCQCIVDSENCNQTAYASSKKIAKKYAAYLAICKICGLENKYEKEE